MKTVLSMNECINSKMYAKRFRQRKHLLYDTRRTFLLNHPLPLLHGHVRDGARRCHGNDGQHLQALSRCRWHEVINAAVMQDSDGRQRPWEPLGTGPLGLGPRAALSHPELSMSVRSHGLRELFRLSGEFSDDLPLRCPDAVH